MPNTKQPKQNKTKFIIIFILGLIIGAIVTKFIITGNFFIKYRISNDLYEGTCLWKFIPKINGWSVICSKNL